MNNDERMARIEERLERLSEETRLQMRAVEVRLDQMATKADLERAKNSILKWVVGTIFGADVVAITVMTFVLNNAVPKTAAVARSGARHHSTAAFEPGVTRQAALMPGLSEVNSIAALCLSGR